MKKLIRLIRRRFHPVFHARKSAFGRLLIRMIDRPIWLSMQGVNFKVCGRLLTHGAAFAITGSQEINPEALSLVCMRELKLRSFWDVGANIGYYTWLVKSAWAETEAVLFEPLPSNVALIRRTILRNALRNTTLIPSAVSSASGTGILKADTCAGTTSTMVAKTTFEERHWGLKPATVEVSLVSIDDVRAKFAPVDFIKVDVEGHEEAVLRGAHRTISSDQPFLLVECSHPGRLCLNACKDVGYTLVDADHLSLELDAASTNFLCVPPRFLPSIPRLLLLAQQEVAKSTS